MGRLTEEREIEQGDKGEGGWRRGRGTSDRAANFFLFAGISSSQSRWVVLFQIGLRIEFFDRLYHVAFRGIRQLGINRDRDRLRGGLLRTRHIPGPVAEAFETFLDVQGNRIIDFAAYPVGLQVSLKLVPVLDPEGVLIVDVELRADLGILAPRDGDVREDHRRAAEDIILEDGALIYGNVVLDLDEVSDRDVVPDVDVLAQDAFPAYP
jgi:hypothetical protein